MLYINKLLRHKTEKKKLTKWSSKVGFVLASGQKFLNSACPLKSVDNPLKVITELTEVAKFKLTLFEKVLTSVNVFAVDNFAQPAIEVSTYSLLVKSSTVVGTIDDVGSVVNIVDPLIVVLPKRVCVAFNLTKLSFKNRSRHRWLFVVGDTIVPGHIPPNTALFEITKFSNNKKKKKSENLITHYRFSIT